MLPDMFPDLMQFIANISSNISSINVEALAPLIIKAILVSFIGAIAARSLPKEKSIAGLLILAPVFVTLSHADQFMDSAKLIIGFLIETVIIAIASKEQESRNLALLTIAFVVILAFVFIPRTVLAANADSINHELIIGVVFGLALMTMACFPNFFPLVIIFIIVLFIADSSLGADVFGDLCANIL